MTHTLLGVVIKSNMRKAALDTAIAFNRHCPVNMQKSLVMNDPERCTRICGAIAIEGVLLWRGAHRSFIAKSKSSVRA